MKRYLTEKAIVSVVRSYDYCIQQERLATNSFSAEYWKGKKAGIIEALCHMAEMQWPTAEDMLDKRRKAMLREIADKGEKK